MNFNPIRRSAIRKKPKEHKESAPWRRTKVRLNGREMAELRQNVFARSEMICENDLGGKRCSERLTWNSFHLHHREHRSLGGSDSMENCLAVCFACHQAHHAGKIRIKPHQDWIAEVR